MDLTAVDFILDTYGPEDYLSPFVGSKHANPLDLATSWADYNARVDPRVGAADWTTNPDGTKGREGTTSNDVYASQHLRYQYVCMRRDYFPEIPCERQNGIALAIAEYKRHYDDMKARCAPLAAYENGGANWIYYSPSLAPIKPPAVQAEDPPPEDPPVDPEIPPVDPEVPETAVRFARPASDVTKGLWQPSSGNDLYAMLNEAQLDLADYITASEPTGCEIALGPVADPGTRIAQALRYEAHAPDGGNLTVTLKQGNNVIASRFHATLPVQATVHELVLTPDECDSITDYGDLRVELVVS